MNSFREGERGGPLIGVDGLSHFEFLLSVDILLLYLSRRMRKYK